MAYLDLHAHLRNLEQRGMLRRIARPIDKNTELHPLVRLHGIAADAQTMHEAMFLTKTA